MLVLSVSFVVLSCSVTSLILIIFIIALPMVILILQVQHRDMFHFAWNFWGFCMGK